MSTDTLINYARQVYSYVQSHKLYTLIASHALSFISGLAIGLFMLGWWLMPVQWIPAGYNTLADSYKYELVYTTADLFAYNRNVERIGGLLNSWDGGELACELAANEPNLDMRARLIALTRVTGTECNYAR